MTEGKIAFQPGTIVATVGAMEVATRQQLAEILARHLACDWGEVPDEDKRANEWSLKHGARLLSAYTVEGPDGKEKLWVLTEADRSATTVLCPHEY